MIFHMIFNVIYDVYMVFVIMMFMTLLRFMHRRFVPLLEAVVLLIATHVIILAISTAESVSIRMHEHRPSYLATKKVFMPCFITFYMIVIHLGVIFI